ncbi:MAG TPA: cation diffusion facilitator family transporter [Pyrinomonadaceae bacterium]|nr:cation diffusion facilitator family transporter [Pyrinomonadaceae bacterium]
MAHAHHHGATPAGQRLAWSTVITLCFVVTEAIAGYFSHSLALLSDAGHNFADALALIIAWYGVWIAQKPSTARRTFGYHRVGTLAALVNSVSLVVIALVIFWEAAQRLGQPAPVHSKPMIVVASLAIVMNATISLWLRRDAKNDLNLRSAYIHMVGDAISALGVVIAGVIVAVTGASIADPLVSILIGMLILASSWGILKESVDVLLEATPAGMNIAEVEKTIAQIHGVLAVHDLHVWTIGSGMICCSCHVMVNEQSVRSGENVLRGVTEQLRSKFGIAHTTIQVEVEGCDPNDMFCLQKIVQHHH